MRRASTHDFMVVKACVWNLNLGVLYEYILKLKGRRMKIFASDEVLKFYGANNNANTGHEKSTRVG